MKIPSEFKVFGKTIKVKFDDNINYKEDRNGMASYRTNTITLQPRRRGAKRPVENVEVTYLHELFHFIFFFAERSKLRDDEELINLCANILHQILQTSKYEKNN